MCLAFRKDDLIHKEEDHHGDAAVEHGGADVVDEVRHQQTSHCHPDAVDGVDNAGNDTERQQIPADLLGQIALAAEHKIALDGEVDALADDHGDHVGAEVGQAAVGGIVAQDVPLEGLAEQGDINARPAEIHHRQAGKGLGQELQQQVLEHRDEVGHDDEQAALPHPLGSCRVLCRKIVPEIHIVISLLSGLLVQLFLIAAVRHSILHQPHYAMCFSFTKRSSVKRVPMAGMMMRLRRVISLMVMGVNSLSNIGSLLLNQCFR